MRIKPKARVTYVGELTPGLKGRSGNFIRYDSKGWALVKFDCNPIEAVKCAAVNLKVVANDNHP